MKDFRKTHGAAQHTRGEAEACFTGNILETNIPLTPSAVGVDLTSEAIENFVINDLLARSGINDALSVVSVINTGVKDNQKEVQVLLVMDGNSKHVREGGETNSNFISKIVESEYSKVRLSSQLNSVIGTILARDRAEFSKIKGGRVCIIPLNFFAILGLMLRADMKQYTIMVADLHHTKKKDGTNLIFFKAFKALNNKKGKKKFTGNDNNVRNAVDQFLQRNRHGRRD